MKSWRPAIVHGHGPKASLLASVAARLCGVPARLLSLDELPQLFNVVRGEMSLTGPRPLLLSYLPRYNEQQKHRHDVLPGITGWAQVHHPRIQIGEQTVVGAGSTVIDDLPAYAVACGSPARVHRFRSPEAYYLHIRSASYART